MGYRFKVTGFKLQVTGYRLQVTGSGPACRHAGASVISERIQIHFFKATQEKLAASLISPLPLYLATFG
jgi:hypothetical protein